MASSLKTFALIEGIGYSHATIPLPVWAVYAATSLEFLLGLWTLAQPFSRTKRSALLLVFLLFAGISLHAALSGAAVCGCFGFLVVSPWLTLSFDVAALCALLTVGSPSRSISDEQWRFGFRFTARVASLIVLAATTVGLVTSGLQAHLNRKNFSHEVATPSLAGLGYGLSLNPNLSILLPPLGTILQQVSRLQHQVESTERFLQLVLDSHGLNGFEPIPISLAEFIRAEQEQEFKSPYVVKTTEDRVYLVLGVVVDQGTSYYQLLQGGDAPFLFRKRHLDDVLSEVWMYSVGRDDPRMCGVTLTIGDATLTIDRLYHNFGRIHAYDTEMAKFRLTNSGSSRIDLGQLSVSCSCTRAHFESNTRVLEAGESAVLHTTMDIATGNMRQQVTVTVTDSTSRKSEKFKLDLLGSQLQAMTVTPNRLDFGRVGTSVRRTIRLSEVSTDRFEITDVEVGSAPIQWSLREQLQANGQYRDYVIDLDLQRGALAPGIHEDSITVRTNSHRLPYVTFPLSFEVPSRVQLQPKTLAFGSIPEGGRMKKSASVNVPSESDIVVRVENGPLRGFDARVINRGDHNHEVIVEFTAENSGSVNQTIELSVSSGQWAESLELNCVAFVQPNRLDTPTSDSPIP
ncbi:MAG: DUF1573 domain-containing protein [Planctomycetota bacterium]